MYFLFKEVHRYNNVSRKGLLHHRVSKEASCRQLSSSLLLQKLLCVATLALLCLFVARCALRSRQWQSERSLFTSALAVCPLNAKVHYNVGKNLADSGNASAAIGYYREAVR